MVSDSRQRLDFVVAVDESFVNEGLRTKVWLPSVGLVAVLMGDLSWLTGESLVGVGEVDCRERCEA